MKETSRLSRRKIANVLFVCVVTTVSLVLSRKQSLLFTIQSVVDTDHNPAMSVAMLNSANNWETMTNGSYESTYDKGLRLNEMKAESKFSDVNPSWNVSGVKIRLASKTSDVCLLKNFTSYDQKSKTNMTAARINNFLAASEGLLKMSVHMYDRNNKSKAFGGDAILVWATETNGDGKVAAEIFDHNNGTYTVTVHVFWTGVTTVHLKLVSSAEYFCSYFQDWKNYGRYASAENRNSYTFMGYFRRNDFQEWTECGPLARIYDTEQLCNLSSVNGNMSWFCIKPQHEQLSCSDIIRFKTDLSVTSNRQRFPSFEETDSRKSISVLITKYSNRKKELSCKARPAIESWTEQFPNGFWRNNTWNFVNCKTTLQHTIPEYRSCLKNKNLYLIGDSSVEQYALYFLTEVMEVEHVWQYLLPTRVYHPYMLATGHDIRLTFFRHEMPFHGKDGYTSQGITSVPQILKFISNSSDSGDSDIILVTYNSHYAMFPPEVYRDRLKALRISIKTLLLASPRSRVFFKGLYPIYKDSLAFDVKIWMVFDELLREELSDVMDKIVLLDVWSIIVAHEEWDLHPKGNALISQIQQFMTYLC